MSARAFTIAAFCFSVRFSASTIVSGRVIHPGAFVENGASIEIAAFVAVGNSEYVCAKTAAAAITPAAAKENKIPRNNP